MSPRTFLSEDMCICRDPHCDIPFGDCHCGCGQKTPIANQSYSRDGSINGMPTKYRIGHSTKKRNAKKKMPRSRFVPEGRRTPNLPLVDIPIQKNFYVYGYVRSVASRNGSVGSPYYIGKGKGRRAWQKLGRSTFLPSIKKNVKMLAKNLSEVEALQLEMLLIHFFGRVDLGTGILHNKTDGGDGGWGTLISDEDRKKKSEILSARWKDESARAKTCAAISRANKGRKHSEETKRKWSEQRKGRRWSHPMSQETKDKIAKAHIGKKKYVPRLPKHGTLYEYRLGCRCELCRKCASESRNKSRDKKKGIDIERPPNVD